MNLNLTHHLENPRKNLTHIVNAVHSNFAQLLRAIARGVIGPDHRRASDEDDAVQDVLFDIVKKPSFWTGKKSAEVEPLLRRMIRCRAVDLLRKRRKMVGISVLAGKDGERDPHEVYQDKVMVSPDIVEILEHEQIFEDIVRLGQTAQKLLQRLEGLKDSPSEETPEQFLGKLADSLGITPPEIMKCFKHGLVTNVTHDLRRRERRLANHMPVIQAWLQHPSSSAVATKLKRTRDQVRGIVGDFVNHPLLKHAADPLKEPIEKSGFDPSTWVERPSKDEPAQEAPDLKQPLDAITLAAVILAHK